MPARCKTIVSFLLLGHWLGVPVPRTLLNCIIELWISTPKLIIFSINLHISITLKKKIFLKVANTSQASQRSHCDFSYRSSHWLHWEDTLLQLLSVLIYSVMQKLLFHTSLINDSILFSFHQNSLKYYFQELLMISIINFIIVMSVSCPCQPPSSNSSQKVSII